MTEGVSLKHTIIPVTVFAVIQFAGLNRNVNYSILCVGACERENHRDTQIRTINFIHKPPNGHKYSWLK